MEAISTRYPNLASEMFSHGKTHYYFDVKKAANDTHFLLITSSERYGEGQFHRRTVQFWEEDLASVVEALSMVLRQLAHGELSSPEVKMELLKDPKGMKAVAEYDRPREKLHALGAGQLTNTELLAILLCTGSPELSVLELCGKLMDSVDNRPERLLRKTADDFCRLPGIGTAKAAVLLAALELGRRVFVPVGVVCQPLPGNS